MNINDNITLVYFGKYINDNIISLDILDANLLEYLKNNFEIKNSYNKKDYQYNNLYYEIKNKKHKCFKKNNQRLKEFNKNNIVVKIFSYDRKYLDLDIFPSLKEYYNEEEYKITEFGDNLELINSGKTSYLILKKNDQELINQITKVLN